MELAEIEHDQVTIKLNPRDCYWLAEACGAAEVFLDGSVVVPEHFGYGSRQEATGDSVEVRRLWYETLAVALKAAAVAGEAEYLTGVDGPPTLDYVRRRYSGKGEQFPPLKVEPAEEAPPAE